MEGAPQEAPPISYGVRVAAFVCLSVLLAVLVAALAVELEGRDRARRAAGEQLQRAHTIAASRLRRDGESLERLAATVARDPKFFALLALRRSERTATFRQSLEGVIRDFQADAGVEIFDVTDEWGATVAASSRPSAPEPSRGTSPLVRRALAGSEALGYRLEGGRLSRIAVVPVLAGERAPIGTLTLGAPIDDGFASVIRGATGADVILLAGEKPADEGPAAAAHPIVTTLSAAAARSVLETLGPSPRSIGRSRLRDERDVSLAKAPALALDVSLDGAMEGGSARLVVVAPLDLDAALGPLRETLLAAGAIAAAAALSLGLVVGRRMSRRVRRLGLAAREAAIGNYDEPLPEHGRDEIGILTADFAGMREAHRREVDRLRDLDRMKSDFFGVASQNDLAPVLEIGGAGRTLASKGAPALSAPAVNDIVPAASSAAPARGEEASVTVVSREAEFHTAAPAAPSPNGPLDVAALVESVAVDLIVAGAERGIEVGIAIESDLLHPVADAAALEAALREYGSRAIAELPPGSCITCAARRTEGAIEIRLEGGASPLLLSLPSPAPNPSAPGEERRAS